MSGVWVSGLWLVVALLVVVLLAAGWRLSWMATRLDRAHSRAERTWAALDAALVRRAHRAQELAGDPRLGATTAAELAAAATAALTPDLTPDEREIRESALSGALSRSATLSRVGASGGELEQQRAVLARRLHNDAVTTALGLRRRRTVAWFRLAGHAQEPRSFEMADFTRHSSAHADATPTYEEPSPGVTKVASVSGKSHATR